MSSPTALAYIFLGGIVGLIVLYVFEPLRMLSQGEGMVVERWGVFNREVFTGWAWVWPFFESARSVEWRFNTEDRSALGTPTQRTEYFRGWRIPVEGCMHQVPPTACSTGDGRTVTAGISVDYKIVKLKKAVYTQELFLRLESQLRSELQAAVSSLTEHPLLEAKELENVLRSRVGAMKWPKENGLELNDCALSGFVLSGNASGASSKNQLPPVTQLDMERENMRLDLEVLQKAKTMGLDNDVLIAYLQTHKTNALQ